MSKIVGVRLKKAKDVCFFDSGETELKLDDYVVVETARGIELATVTVEPREVAPRLDTEPLKPIIRKAEPEDIRRGGELEAKEREALAECGKLVEKLKLPMKLLSADYDFDGKRVTIHFRSEERVDFRELVRELAGQLKIRVELRQTRPRDEAKAIGGCGRCGRTLCCSGFLTEFAPVSIKMAKVQNLPLNPMKISGVCGRLMCCLVYENEFYQSMKGKMPRDNQRVSTASGMGKVVGNNPLKETVLIELDESQATVELPLNEITLIKTEPQAVQQPKPKEPPAGELRPQAKGTLPPQQSPKTEERGNQPSPNTEARQQPAVKTDPPAIQATLTGEIPSGSEPAKTDQTETRAEPEQTQE